MRKKTLSILLIIITILGVGEISAQCDCIGLVRKDGYKNKYVDAYDELNNSDAVFVGEVVEVKRRDKVSENDDLNDFLEVTYKVEQSWKGVKSKLITILEEVAHKGDRMLIYARYYKGRLLEGGCCSRSKMLSKASADLILFKQKNLKPIKLK